MIVPMISRPPLNTFSISPFFYRKMVKIHGNFKVGLKRRLPTWKTDRKWRSSSSSFHSERKARSLIHLALVNLAVGDEDLDYFTDLCLVGAIDLMFVERIYQPKPKRVSKTFNDFTHYQCWDFFRFKKEDMERLCKALRMNGRIFRTSRRERFLGEEFRFRV